ncbi:SpoIIE family protein phosphatase [Algisphaera agarilytica]|uniref:Serine phosphatase RsbU (Regulator of sigma subunit) n=1 Tax=Algisphaera agarilytica TaxID=1385975 RepID=A0A7X0H7N6_9BACT|nr:SpoIIE family protein phosphatase [Algisphaera agarilytica]MBB6430805.1 serine phosphatase RsbU (regulator of sigma subunit) [Algisphaera agarilytica]
MRLSTKLLVISELVLLVLAFALLVPTRSGMREQVTVDLQNQLAAIASTAALHLDGGLHQRVVETQDANDPAFLQLRDQLRAIRDVNGLASDHIYTFYFGSDGLLHFGVMPHEGDPFIGDVYELKSHHQEALSSGQVTVTGLYEDVNGEWISAAAPIYSSAGQVVGLLEVTQPSEAYFARYNQLLLVNTLIAVVGIAISSLLGYLVLNKIVIRPVDKIHKGLEALGEHNFNHRVDIRTRDEFQELGEALNVMADQLNVARSIQAGFFPEELPACRGYRMAGASEPCDATGGDYYDAFKLDDQRTVVVMADVTGHGLGPSLIMATCRSALHALARTGLEPGELIQRLEDHLTPDLTEGRFITMILGVLDDDGTFTYANAGHAPAMIRTANHGVTHLDSHRPPLGVIIPLDGEELQSSVHLHPGDRVLLTSDGVNEAQNPANKQFGFAPLERLIDNLEMACDQVVSTLRRDVGTHRHPRPADDDLTILCIDRVGVAVAMD